MVAARAGREIFFAVRAVDFVLLRVGAVGLRATDVAARETFDVFFVRAGTDVRMFVVVRVLVERGVVVDVRAAIERDAVDCVFVLRVPAVVRDVTVFVPLRAAVFSSRTAALAMPTLTINAIIKIHAFFIP